MAVDAILLRIDTELVDPLDVVFEFQADPFPGGHHFELVIQRSAIPDDVWEYADLKTAVPPTEEQVRNGFYWLASILSRDASDDRAPARFVLNTVRHCVVGPYGVQLDGVSSPVLRW